MQDRLSQFVRKVIVQAVETVTRGDCHDSRLKIQADNKQSPIWVTVEICPPRHGCGWEQTAYWAHSNDGDRFAASQAPGLNVARNSSAELVQDIYAFVERELAGASRVDVQLIFMPYQGQSFLPMLEGDSERGYLRDIPEFNGM